MPHTVQTADDLSRPPLDDDGGEVVPTAIAAAAVPFRRRETARAAADYLEARYRTWSCEVRRDGEEYVLAIHDTADREYAFLGYL